MLAIIYFERGVCYFMTGDYQLALDDWKKTEDLFHSNDFIDYNPLHMHFTLYRSELYINFAVAHFYLGDRNECQKYMDLAKREKKMRDNLDEWVAQMNDMQEIYPITLDDQTLFAPPVVKLPGQEPKATPAAPVATTPTPSPAAARAISPQPARPPPAPVAKPLASSPTSSAPAPPPVPAKKAGGGPPPPPPSKPGAPKAAAATQSIASVPGATSRFATETKVVNRTTAAIPASPFAVKKDTAASPPPVPSPAAANAASNLKLNFKVLASYGDRKKKIVKENFSGYDDVRNEVITAFDMTPSPSHHIEMFDDDFNEWIELDRKTDMASLSQLLKIRVIER
jgi:tetratricopeptide (TPR) repeat protein